jgi:hypothetical protein
MPKEIDPIIEEAFRIGTKVIIKGIEKTKPKYGFNQRMEPMIGETYKIKSQAPEEGIRINGFTWDYEDLEIVNFLKHKKRSIPKKVKFDIKEIWNKNNLT